MAKAKKEATAPTAEQLAELDAKRILEIREQKAALDKELKLAQERLIEWAVQNGHKTLFGLLTVAHKQNPPKLHGATGELLKIYTEKLLIELDAVYVKEEKSLDLKRMAAGLETDATLSALLKVKGLSILQEVGTELRKI